MILTLEIRLSMDLGSKIQNRLIKTVCEGRRMGPILKKGGMGTCGSRLTANQRRGTPVKSLTITINFYNYMCKLMM